MEEEKDFPQCRKRGVEPPPLSAGHPWVCVYSTCWPEQFVLHDLLFNWHII